MVARNFYVSAVGDLDDVQEVFQLAMMPEGLRLLVDQRKRPASR
jgi:hypothetical protein